MVWADMANPPEHDFAPAWLKIPSNQQSSRQPHVNHTSQGSRLGSAEEKYRSRHYSTDSPYGFGRSPTHEPFGFRGRDERRNYSSPSARHHSVDELPWDPDPTTNWNYSQFNDTSGPAYGMGYPRRGSSVPRNGQQYSNNGRFDGSGYGSSRGGFQQGKPAGRQRFNSGSKSAYSEEHPNETTSKKEDGQGDGGDETGKEGDNKSALSNQDFPSLSGAGDDVESITTVKNSVPSGAWEKPPGTTKVISGRKVQLVKKSISSSSESKSTSRSITPASTAMVDTSAGSKVGGQTGSSSQSAKVMAASNVSSSIVLKSMTSVTPMVSSRSKEPAIRSAPVPTSRISPVPSKPSQVAPPSRSAPVPINPSPTTINKTPINKLPVNKTPVSKPPIHNPTVNQSPPNKSTTPASTRPPLNSVTTSVPTVPIQQPPVTNKADTSTILPSTSPVSVKSMPVLIDSSKAGSVIDKPTTPPAKPTAITNMSAAPNRFTSAPNRSSLLCSRPAPVFPRPAPTSSSRQTPVSIMSRPTPAPVVANNSTPAGLHSGPVGSASDWKEKSVPPIHASTLQPLTKGPPSPIPTSIPPIVVPMRSPTTSKPKKGDKLDFLNELRRSSNGDLSKEVSKNNQENLRGLEETVWRRNGPSSMPKTILQSEHVIKTNGIDIDNDLTTIEKGTQEDTIPNFYPVFSPVRDGPDISSSLEAEKRLLQEMGWHEHSDNEDGYAPLTEDELKEFRKKSQQLKRNGLTRALPAAWNSVSLPTGSIAQVSLEDGFTSSDSDSDDDVQS